MPNAFEDLMAEARDAGVSQEFIDRIQAATDASPLRKEKRELEDRLKESTEAAGRYRTAALTSQFEKIGIAVKPQALNIPSDLDPLNEEAIREWAVGMGLAQPVEATTPEVQAATERIVGASEGAPPPSASSARDEVLAAETQDEFWARAKATGVAQ